MAVGPDREFRSEPERFEVGRGHRVLWVWESGGHDVSPGARSADADWSGDDETTYQAGHTYAHTFEVPGSHGSHCAPHESLGMAGSFTVSTE